MKAKVKKIKILMVPLIVLGVTFIAHCQERFTLEQAVSAGLEYNHGLQVEELNASQAEQRVSRGYAGLLPRMSINGSLEQAYGSVELAPGSYFLDLIGGQFGDEPPIPSSVRYNGVTSITTSVGLGGQMVIYDGGKGQIRYRLLQTASDAAGLRHRHRMEQTVLEITHAYVKAALLQESLALQREIVQLGYDRYRTKQHQRRYGQLSEQELLQAQTDLKADSSDYRELQHQFEKGYRVLHKVIGWEVQPQAELQVDLPVASLSELDAMKTLGEMNNTLLSLREYQVNLANYELRLAESEFYPRLMASAQLAHRYEYTSAGQFESREHWGLSGGVTLQVPLFEGGRRSIDRQNAQASFRQSQIKREKAKRQFETELDNTLSRFEQLEEEQRTLHGELQMNERKYERAVQAHNQGLITSTELRQVRLGLLSTRLKLTDVQLQMKLTETIWLYANGQLLVKQQTPLDPE